MVKHQSIFSPTTISEELPLVENLDVEGAEKIKLVLTKCSSGGKILQKEKVNLIYYSPIHIQLLIQFIRFWFS